MRAAAKRLCLGRLEPAKAVQSPTVVHRLSAGMASLSRIVVLRKRHSLLLEAESMSAKVKVEEKMISPRICTVSPHETNNPFDQSKALTNPNYVTRNSGPCVALILL